MSSLRFRAGLLALFAAGGPADRIDLFNLICVPGLVEAVTIAALQQCARDRRALLLVDCAETATADDAISSLAGKTGTNADHAAFYFPWVEAPDPLQEGLLRAFPRAASSPGSLPGPIGTKASGRRRRALAPAWPGPRG